MTRAQRRFDGFRLVSALFALLLVAVPAEAVQWKRWNEGLEAARRTGRPVLVDVYTDWCGWCRRMDADVYARPDVGEYLEGHFVLVKLNAESSEATPWQGQKQTARTLSNAFGVSGFPTTVFLDSEGQRLVNVPGYIPAERFLLLLRYIGDGHMARNVGWDDYVKQTKPEISTR